jgi:hypothetical protein
MNMVTAKQRQTEDRTSFALDLETNRLHGFPFSDSLRLEALNDGCGENSGRPNYNLISPI